MGDPNRRYGASSDEEVSGGPSSTVVELATSENTNSNTELVEAHQASGDTLKISEQSSQQIGVRASTPQQQVEPQSFLGNCYRCQEKGHVSKNCPRRKRNRSPCGQTLQQEEGDTTKILEQTGVRASTLGQQVESQSFDGLCFICQEKGHMARNCQKQTRNSHPRGHTSHGVRASTLEQQVERLCFKCQEKGHIAKKCPKQTRNSHPRGHTSHQQQDIDGVEASDSDVEGDSVEILKQSLQQTEVRKNTHANQVEPKSFTGFCYICREKGHTARNCPEQTTDSHQCEASLRQQQVTDVVEASKSVEGVQQIEPQSFDGVCYKCREKGHIAKNCLKQKKDSQPRGQTSQQLQGTNGAIIMAHKEVEGFDLAVEGSVLRSSFPGYLSYEPSYLTSHHLWSSNDLQASSSDYLQKDILPLRPGGYSIDDITGIGVRPGPGLSGLTAGASIKGYTSPLQDPSLLRERRDAIVDSRGIPELINGRHDYLRKVDGLPVPAGHSNILFIDGLPNDCSRREVGHLFRPFIGFKEIRVVHKEPRRSGDRAMVLCFVEFGDSKCALTAMEALQGYKFDDKKPDSPGLRIHIAHFPFRLPSDHDTLWFEGPR